VTATKSILLLSLLCLQCLASAPSGAQTSPASCLAYPACAWYSNNSGCVPTLPPGAFNCMQSGPWSQTCTIMTNKCPAICWDCVLGTPSGGEPINLATGDVFVTQSDLSIPGLGGGLSLSRTWHSQFPFTEAVPTSGMFGGNWRSTYEESIFVSSGGLVKYVRGTGSIWTLGLAGLSSPLTYSMVAPANANLSLVFDGTYWTLTFNSGEKRIFNAAGYLQSISDRNGNTTQLTYDSSSRLITVTDPASRHLYFSYASPSSNLVVGVSSDVGISLSYGYDAQWRLATVTKPDSTTVSFQYDGNSMVTAVLDTNGKVLEAHTYDSERRGVTSSRAGGVDAMTITYPFLMMGVLP
jgi:YD repeat-containing protein